MKQWKLTIGNEKQVPVINLFYANRRYRFWTGKVIGLKITSVDYPELLKAAFELKLIEGWRPTQKTKQEVNLIPTVIDILNKGISDKISQGCSDRYIKDAKRVVTLWKRFVFITQHAINYAVADKCIFDMRHQLEIFEPN